MEFKNSCIKKEDFNTVYDAMDTLGECICKYPSGGFKDKDGQDWVDVMSLVSREEVIDAIKVIFSVYGIKIENGEIV